MEVGDDESKYRHCNTYNCNDSVAEPPLSLFGSTEMDMFMDEDLMVTSNSSHRGEQQSLEGNRSQGLNRGDPLDMFTGMELLLRFKPLFMPLYCLVVVIASVGNSFLLACILADKKLHNATNYFIGNLAAGDLLMCLSCVPLTMSYAFDSQGWAFGRPLCHLIPLLQCATVFASVLSLTAIAVDRYVVISKSSSLWLAASGHVKDLKTQILIPYVIPDLGNLKWTGRQYTSRFIWQML